MILSKTVNTKGTVKLTRPLSYEYDSDTQSVVLLDGYEYNIVFKKSIKNISQKIDLTNSGNMIKFITDFIYGPGLVWSIYVDDVYIGDSFSGDNSVYVEDVLTAGVSSIFAEYNNDTLTLTNTSTNASTFKAVANNPLLVDFSTVTITPNIYQYSNGVFTVTLEPRSI